ncbi:urease accessory protein [Antricoccus suffuscus]|uniref:Urease accessory protein UreD n=1 Tax=Antricoccus suffuscus TaxID=1629062 RepID=A0A2T1A5P5_9ACTN|nr:urease accessory protein UreD [Antricoccus suffuscus]PRZ43935.1 urease accessory protein [Antricoccus suffuscus]
MSRPRAARIAVERDSDRVRIVALDGSDFVRPRLLRADGHHVSVAFVSSSATLLAGDDLRIDIDVGPGVSLELVEPSGMVAYNARGGQASWSACVRVGDDAHVTWAAAPFVVAGGADVLRRTEIELADGASMLLRELLVLGRHNEVGGCVRSMLEASLASVPLLVEDLDLREPLRRSAPGILGSARVLGTVALLGVCRPPSECVHETSLAGPGALARCIATDAHTAWNQLAPVWRRWHGVVNSPIWDTHAS